MIKELLPLRDEIRHLRENKKYKICLQKCNKYLNIINNIKNDEDDYYFIYFMITKCNLHLKDFDSAMFYVNKILKIVDNKTRRYADTLWLKGRIYQEMRKAQKAIMLINRSLYIYCSLLNNADTKDIKLYTYCIALLIETKADIKNDVKIYQDAIDLYKSIDDKELEVKINRRIKNIYNKINKIEHITNISYISNKQCYKSDNNENYYKESIL